mgnify:CR=1 FL=1
MAWVAPKFTSTEYNTAGKVLISGVSVNGMSIDDALIIINNWRLAHHRPLNAFQRRLRRLAYTVEKGEKSASQIKEVEVMIEKIIPPSTIPPIPFDEEEE